MGMAKRTNKQQKRAFTVNDLCSAMERIAPTWAAADWDNVGLLVGGRDWPVTRLMLTIDMTAAVLQEVQRKQVDAVVCYHPVIFKATNKLVVGTTSQEGIAAALLSQRVAVFSPHTALDAVPGGTNETLARLSGATNLRPFQTATKPTRDCKLVAFVPPSHVDAVAQALFAAGAGRIGDYEQCSYRLDGKGTFFGTDATNPAVGKRGQLESVSEIRLEVIVPTQLLVAVVAALVAAHPYEEPAYDIFPLQASPLAGVGQGRIGDLPAKTTASAVYELLSRQLKAPHALLVGSAKQYVKRAFVCVGSAGTMPLATDEGGASVGDIVITGEIRHHDALAYQRCGAVAIALGHWTSERPALRPLRTMLQRALPSLDIQISQKDAEPFGLN